MRSLTDQLDALLVSFAARAPHSPAAMLRVEAPAIDVRYENAVGSFYHGGPPVQADAAYACASIGKSFLAATCLRLVERGRLTLDEPIATHLPVDQLDRLTRYGDRRHGADVTLRHLLDHTSGIEDLYQPPYRYADRLLAAGARTQRLTLVDQVHAMLDVPAVAPPGRAWRYSDANYTLAGQLVEAVEGVGVHELIRREVIEPLDLTSTWSRGFESPRRPVVAAYAPFDGVPGHEARAIDTNQELNGTWELAGGGIDLTLADSVRFIDGLLGGRLVAPATIAEMCTAVDLSLAAAPIATRGTSGYGLGLYSYDIEGLRFWGHDGMFGQRLAGCRDLGLTLSISFNAWNSGTGDRDEDLRTELGQAVVRLFAPQLRAI